MSACGKCSARTRRATRSMSPSVIIGPDGHCLTVEGSANCRVFASPAAAVAEARSLFGDAGWSIAAATV